MWLMTYVGALFNGITLLILGKNTVAGQAVALVAMLQGEDFQELHLLHGGTFWGTCKETG